MRCKPPHHLRTMRNFQLFQRHNEIDRFSTMLASANLCITSKCLFEKMRSRWDIKRAPTVQHSTHREWWRSIWFDCRSEHKLHDVGLGMMHIWHIFHGCDLPIRRTDAEHGMTDNALMSVECNRGQIYQYIQFIYCGFDWLDTRSSSGLTYLTEAKQWTQCDHPFVSIFDNHVHKADYSNNVTYLNNYKLRWDTNFRIENIQMQVAMEYFPNDSYAPIEFRQTAHFVVVYYAKWSESNWIGRMQLKSFIRSVSDSHEEVVWCITQRYYFIYTSVMCLLSRSEYPLMFIAFVQYYSWSDVNIHNT